MVLLDPAPDASIHDVAERPERNRAVVVCSTRVSFTPSLLVGDQKGISVPRLIKQASFGDFCAKFGKPSSLHTVSGYVGCSRYQLGFLKCRCTTFFCPELSPVVGTGFSSLVHHKKISSTGSRTIQILLHKNAKRTTKQPATASSQ